MLTQEQIDLLNSCTYGTWKYEDGVVNVIGNVGLHRYNLTSIPVQFGKVSGRFFCYDNNLTSLKGCPSEVGTDFYCYDAKLTSLEHMPLIIGGKIDFYKNPFILNDKLFADIARIKKNNEIRDYSAFLSWIRKRISDQFGLTESDVIDEIYHSYMNILGEKFYGNTR